MNAARIHRIECDPRTAETFSPQGIGVADGLTSAQVIELARTRGLRHLLHREGSAFATELALAKRMIGRPEDFFADPVGSLLGTSDGDEFIYRCSHGGRKSDFLTGFESYLRSLSGVRRARENAMMIADELFTNGAKHAFPTRRISLAKSIGKLEFVAHVVGDRLAISCTDSFGLLDVQAPLEGIARCLEHGVGNAIRNGPGGAGIGSFLVFSASTSYCLAVDPGKRSTICCAVPISARAHEGESLPKNLHILVMER